LIVHLLQCKVVV